MKTRREFLKTLLSGTAALATAVLVPVSLMARPKSIDIEHPKPYSNITSGYANIAELEPLKKLIKTYHPNASGVNVTGPDGLTRFYWTKGAPNG